MSKPSRRCRRALALGVLFGSLVGFSRPFVVCPPDKVAFFHVPKSGGSSVSEMLLRGRPRPRGCVLLGWGMRIAYANSRFSRREGPVKVDVAHLTPSELDSFDSWGMLRKKIFNFTADLSGVLSSDEWKKVAVVRN
ncbi:hypothetical protein ACHAWF_001854, partial [Thalassiosira exigua]